MPFGEDVGTYDTENELQEGFSFARVDSNEGFDLYAVRPLPLGLPCWLPSCARMSNLDASACLLAPPPMPAGTQRVQGSGASLGRGLET
jgi:hypothetical protein